MVIPFFVKNDNNLSDVGAALAAIYFGFAAKAAPTLTLFLTKNGIRHPRQCGAVPVASPVGMQWNPGQPLRQTQDRLRYARCAGYSGQTATQTTPFVLSALRSKVYRSMSGVATAGFRFMRLNWVVLLGF